MILLRLAAVSLLWASATHVSAAEPVRYNRDVRPILSENCFACHGPDKNKRDSGLRLDIRAEAIRAAESGDVAIVPGDAGASQLLIRILSDDADMQMPPPKAHKKLTATQKDLLRRWIAEGAVYEEHWSFIAPQKSDLPAVKHAAWPRNEVDHFVLARLEAEGLSPAAEADAATLCRRLYLDLTGLPPSGEEVAAFVRAYSRTPSPPTSNPGVREHESTSEKAYLALVDRLLASPHFGERMALDWLDAARYADTNGFSIDGGRHMWLWRDWVIQAFNDNLPYDRFLVEQLAGDLLPDATDAQRIATGFQRNNMVTHEGGTIPEENLTNYNADRVKTLGEAVLGLTLGCAQCHDHKYDPITQRDYYQLFAYFNTLADKGLDGNGGVNPGPFMSARTVLQTTEVPKLRDEIAALEAMLAKPNESLLRRWERTQHELLTARGKELKLHPVEVLKVSTPNRGAGFDVEDDGRVRLRQPGDLGAFDISTKLPKLDTPITGLRAVFHPVPELPGGGWGSGPTDARRGRPSAKASAKADAPVPDGPEKGSFMLTAIAMTVDATPGDQVNLHKLQSISRVTANSWTAEHPAADCLDPRNDSGWSPDLATSGPVHFTATLATPIDAADTPYLTVQLNFGAGKSLVPGLIELQVLTGADDGTDLPADVIAILNEPAAERSDEQQARLWSHCAAHAPELQRQRHALANLRERLSTLTEPFPTMVMNVAEKPRETRILHRGDYAQPREVVSAGTIAALPALPTDAPTTRLGLAQWLVMPENPLTARVAVNRVWQMCFGTGLVGTAADFGSQGEYPSHPELLDFLAVDFQQSGWDVKRLVRLVVTSATYRQDSKATKEQLDRDPANRLLARGPRFRLPAEFLRDAALKSSGLLVPRIGGPSVNPYTPGDLWREVSHYGSTPATAQTFVQDHGEKLYRRSLYTYWKRTAPPPNMTAFDAPNREVCTIKRPGTTTPLQALVLLNDPQFVEAGRALAERALAQPGDDAGRLKWAFVEVVSREPSDRELSVLQAALGRERSRYTQSPAAAEAYLNIGESPRNAKLPAGEHAAWAQVAALLLNLSEAVTRR